MGIRSTTSILVNQCIYYSAQLICLFTCLFTYTSYVNIVENLFRVIYIQIHIQNNSISITIKQYATYVTEIKSYI